MKTADRSDVSRRRPSSIRNASCRRLLAVPFLLFPAIAGPGAASSTSAQTSLSIFGCAVPANPVEADYRAVTLGVKFWTSQAGTISAVRFYRGATSATGYVARLYSASGEILGTVSLPKETGPVPGWQTAVFPKPISISAKTTYMAAYYTPDGRYADDRDGLRSGIVNNFLRVPPSPSVGGNGVYYYGLGFPRQRLDASNYYVDVLFTPARPVPILSLSFSPPNPSIPNAAPLGMTVATITASWSNGKRFTGTLRFGPPYSNAGGVFAISGNRLIINPSGPGVGGAGRTVDQVTIVATQ
jgi:hypothetical protein